MNLEKHFFGGKRIPGSSGETIPIVALHLARIIHEITKSFRIPFVRSEFHSVGNTRIMIGSTVSGYERHANAVDTLMIVTLAPGVKFNSLEI